MVKKFEEFLTMGQAENDCPLFAGHQLPKNLVNNSPNSKFIGVFNQECGAEPIQGKVFVQEGKSLPMLVAEALGFSSTHFTKEMYKLMVLMERYYSRNNNSDSLGLSLLYSKYYSEKFMYRFADGFDGFDMADKHYISVEKRKMVEHFQNLSLWIGKWNGLKTLVNVGRNLYPTDTCYYMNNLPGGAHVTMSIDFGQEWASARLTPKGEQLLIPRGFHLGKFVNSNYNSIMPYHFPQISNGGGTATSCGMKFPNDEAINELMTKGQFVQYIQK
jgi:hypothetical protein